MDKKIVEDALNEIRPSLQADGGDISFDKIDGKNVYVRLEGHCAGCPMSQMTLTYGVQNYLRQKVDEEIVVINENEIN